MDASKNTDLLTMGHMQKKYGSHLGLDPNMTLSEYLKKKGMPYMAKIAAGELLNEE